MHTCLNDTLSITRLWISIFSLVIIHTLFNNLLLLQPSLWAHKQGCNIRNGNMIETNLENKSMAWCKPKEVFKPKESCVGMKEDSLKTLILCWILILTQMKGIVADVKPHENYM